MSGDKTPRGGEEKPNFVVIDLTAVNVVPGKNVYSLTFKVMCRVIHCKCSNSHTAALKEPLYLLQVVDWDWQSDSQSNTAAPEHWQPASTATQALQDI